jgi:hypothetical protein|tara:strand:- start:490 stop:756 length:267 start_codon:yes stop_codon:yes gene_type:complete
MAAPNDEFFSFEDSANYVKVNFARNYKTESTRFTLGNIPQSLHGDVKNLAETYSMSIAQTIAALLDFVEEHNDAYKEAIAKKASMSRR